MNEFVVLWGIFSFIFFILAIFHFKTATMKIKHFKILRLTGEQGGVNIEVNVGRGSIDRPIEELERQINNFVDNFNTTNKKTNYAQGTGYIIAFLTSVISLILTI